MKKNVSQEKKPEPQLKEVPQQSQITTRGMKKRMGQEREVNDKKIKRVKRATEIINKEEKKVHITLSQRS